MLRESVVLHESFFGIKAGPLGSLFFYGFLEADVAMISLQRGRLQLQKPLGLTQGASPLCKFALILQPLLPNKEKGSRIGSLFSQSGRGI
ncbi:hypothetical protein O77CONTIG1_02433 [Leptolyngbya sp. O-77]|nr:hypothetical protein O77CONTIG1_02433 [Leptolyngbya sp. O-77]